MLKYQWIYDEAVKLNTQHNKFLIWGTCLGFEALVYSASEFKIQTTEVDTINKPERLVWIQQNYKHSIFKEVMRSSVAETLSQEQLVYFSHHWGFQIKDFLKSKKLRKKFKIIAYYWSKGRQIVAAIQHRRFPIIATQFHPEQTLYEHQLKINVPLTLSSMIASQELSRILFISALENNHRFTNQRLLDILEFKNFNSKKTTSVFETVYPFMQAYFKEKRLKKRIDTIKKIN